MNTSERRAVRIRTLWSLMAAAALLVGIVAQSGVPPAYAATNNAPTGPTGFGPDYTISYSATNHSDGTQSVGCTVTIVNTDGYYLTSSTLDGKIVGWNIYKKGKPPVRERQVWMPGVTATAAANAQEGPPLG